MVGVETARFSRELYAYLIFLYFDFETILVLLCRFESYFRSMNVKLRFLSPMASLIKHFVLFLRVVAQFLRCKLGSALS